MFEALEVGKKINGEEFDARQKSLRQELLTAQFDLAERDYPVIVLIAGLDGAGKGALVHRLNEWMDPRGIETNTFWEHSDEEESHPYFWRFWRKLPPRGKIAIFLGSWYSHAGQAAIDGHIGRKELVRQCQEGEYFERTLSDDGAVIIKLWLHVSRDTQRAQLEGTAPGKKQNPRVTDQPYEFTGSYKKSLKIAERIILETDSRHSPWHLIEAEDRRYRDITAGEIILTAMQQASSRTTNNNSATAITNDQNQKQPTVLETVDLSLSLDRERYKQQLEEYQSRLQELAWDAYRQKRSIVAVFEGWDAAGKGSAIRRVTGALDPRLYRLVQFAAPTDEEKAHHYLWRFWRNLERDGKATLFDRSWYGRLLVERVEGFATSDEWQRAYSEINYFEKQLVNHGSIVLKFWLHISQEEQLARFKAREQEPHKRHKITDDDWRNREKWPDYELAVDEMVYRTSTRHAPWTLISGNDKPYARIQILKTFCRSIERALDT